MKFSDKLAKMRKANNLSQEQLADALGVTRQSVSKWESGESYPDMAKIIQLCRTLNCTINDILDDDVVKTETNEIPKEKSDSEHTNSLQKLFSDFMMFITCSANMISSMSFLQILKMLVELFVLAVILFFIGEFLDWALEDFLWNLFNSMPNVFKLIHAILAAVLKLSEAFFSVFLVLYVYKIRFLDYYVTLTDSNAKTPSVEEPIEENQNTVFSSKKKGKIVIIRDPKHSSSKLIDAIVNVIIFIFKMMIALCALPCVLLLLMGVVALVICIINKGIIFKSSILICLGFIALGSVILIFIYNVLFNRKQMHRMNICLLLASILLSGAGTGLLVNNLKDMKVRKETAALPTSKRTIVLNADDADVIYIESYNVEFIIDETKEDIEMEFTYPSDVALAENKPDEKTGEKTYYYYLRNNTLFEIRLLMDDLSKNCFSVFYNIDNYLSCKVTCNLKNRELFANLGN